MPFRFRLYVKKRNFYVKRLSAFTYDDFIYLICEICIILQKISCTLLLSLDYKGNL